MQVTLLLVTTMLKKIDGYCTETFYDGCYSLGKCILQTCTDHLDRITVDIKEDDFAKLKSEYERIKKEKRKTMRQDPGQRQVRICCNCGKLMVCDMYRRNGTGEEWHYDCPNCGYSEHLQVVK